jgi:nitroreductase
MELQQAIRRRRMTRTYQADRPVPREVIDDLLDLAVRAPSAGFSQGWHFLVLDEPAAVAQFWTATDDGESDSWLERLQTAPALILFFSDKQAYLDRYAEPDKGLTDRSEEHWPVPYWDIDTGMAAMLALLGAEEHDLGACFFGVPAQSWPAVRAAFGVPERLTPIGVISLGYRAPDVRSPSLKRGRRPGVVSYGRYGVTGASGEPGSGSGAASAG